MAPRRKQTPQERAAITRNRKSRLARERAARINARAGSQIIEPFQAVDAQTLRRNVGFGNSENAVLRSRVQSRGAARRARIERATGVRLNPGEQVRNRIAGSAAVVRELGRRGFISPAISRGAVRRRRIGAKTGISLRPGERRASREAGAFARFQGRIQSRGAARRARIAQQSNNRLVLRPGQSFSQEVGRAVQRGARQRTASPATATRELLQGPLLPSGRRANTQEAAQRSLRRSEASRGAERDRGSSRRTNQRVARNSRPARVAAQNLNELRGMVLRGAAERLTQRSIARAPR